MKLTITDLTKTYGSNTAVDHLSLELTPGIVGLLGANGAGKTTTIRLLCDLIPPDSGAVLLDGENIRSLGEDYREILGYLPQKAGYYPWFTAEKHLKYIAALKGLAPSDAAEKTKELLERVGLYAERKKRLQSFSGGMLQRVGIAQALLNDPRILILDEPTAGLDPQERIRFRSMIAGLARDRLVILSTHIVSDIEHIATDVVMLKAGKLVAHDSVPGILEKLEGKVYTVLVPVEKAEQFRSIYRVTNMQPESDRVLLRVVCMDSVPDGAVPVEPSLEDAYMAYCGRVQEC